MSNTLPMTLNEFIIQSQAGFPHAKGELSRIMGDIAIASKIVNREVNKAGLVDILGQAGDTNIQGEEQQKLDIYANDRFIASLRASGMCAGIASEENDEVIIFDDELAMGGKYVVCIDPLDGSSNIDVNVSIGTVFSIYRRLSAEGTKVTEADFLQPGSAQVAAGYVIYGSSTMLVYTTGAGVTGFTLDPSIGSYCLSMRSMQTPENGKIYSVNEGNYVHFPLGVKEYIKYCQAEDASTQRPYSSRYIGSMVADFHRNLIKGGIFMYPATAANPTGKLRLLYECNPIAFLAEQAGGKATDGHGKRILDIEPEALHQRVPMFTGSKSMVEKLEQCIQETPDAG